MAAFARLERDSGAWQIRISLNVRFRESQTTGKGRLVAYRVATATAGNDPLPDLRLAISHVVTRPGVVVSRYSGKRTFNGAIRPHPPPRRPLCLGSRAQMETADRKPTVLVDGDLQPDNAIPPVHKLIEHAVHVLVRSSSAA